MIFKFKKPSKPLVPVGDHIGRTPVKVKQVFLRWTCHRCDKTFSVNMDELDYFIEVHHDACGKEPRQKLWTPGLN